MVVVEVGVVVAVAVVVVVVVVDGTPRLLERKWPGLQVLFFTGRPAGTPTKLNVKKRRDNYHGGRHPGVVEGGGGVTWPFATLGTTWLSGMRGGDLTFHNVGGNMAAWNASG